MALWHFCGVVLLLGITSGPLEITGSKGHLVAALHILVVTYFAQHNYRACSVRLLWNAFWCGLSPIVSVVQSTFT